MKLFVLNSSGELTAKLDMINEAFERAESIAHKSLTLDKVDVVVRNHPAFAIPELGIGGFTETTGWIVYVSIDAGKDVSEKDYFATLVHEFHHAARFRSLKQGYQHDLGSVIIQEGLACLFEEEVTGSVPIYARQKLLSADIHKTEKQLRTSEPYDHDRWFFGTSDIALWFGYSYGYKLCKGYSEKHSKTAAELVDVPADEIIKG